MSNGAIGSKPNVQVLEAAIRWRRVAAAVLAMACLMAPQASARAQSSLSSQSPATVSPRVVVTIKPVHALVAKVMGATGTPDLLVTGNASPHTYALKPSDAKTIGAADVLFRISDRLEPFTLKAAKNLPRSAIMVTLIDTKDLATLKVRTGDTFETHGHGTKAASGHDHDHAPSAKGVAIDAHIWLNPANASVMVDRIEAVLSARAPVNAAIYKANATSAKADIAALTAELQTTLKGLQDKPYVVFHDAYQYFETAFGLTVAGSVTADPDTPPSGKRLSDLRKKISTLGATCVFGEPNFDAKVITTITQGTPARTGTLDPEGAGLEPGPALYENLMRNLAKNVKACLAPPA